MKRIRFTVMLILAGLLASLMTGCSSPAQPSQKEKEEIVNFYIGFAKEATSLDSALIREKYSGLAAQNFAGQGANGARDKMLSEFNSIKPELFSKLYLGGASNGAVANTYLTVLLLSLASESKGVDITMPIDAVSVVKDEKLGIVYEIDRSKITATVPENLSSKITRPDRKTLSPVKLIKDKEDNSWKVVASTNLLAEIGIPISEKISTPTTTK
jgi:hypothetical protein